MARYDSPRNKRHSVFTIGDEDDEPPALPVEAAEEAAVTEIAPPKQPIRVWLLALLMLSLAVATTTASSQLTNLAFTNLKFSAPFLFVLFKSMFRALAFPIYITINTIIKLMRGKKVDFGRTWQRCKGVCGNGGITWRIVLWKFFPPMVFNLAVQIAYTLALQNLSTSMASALAPPAVAISYIFGWLFLKSTLITVKVAFVFVAFAGVGLIAYQEFVKDIDQKVILGISMMIVQDFCLSCYQLRFKIAFPKGDLGQVSFAISGMYTLMSLVYWPVPLILYLVKYEYYDIHVMPYVILLGAWSCTAVTSLVYGYAIVLAGGFFIGLSDLIILALNSVIDVLWRDVIIDDYQIIGTAVISVAFIIMILPDRYLSIDFKGCFQDRRRKKSKAESLKMQQQQRPVRRSRAEKVEVASGTASGAIMHYPPKSTATSTEKLETVNRGFDLGEDDAHAGTAASQAWSSSRTG